MKRCFTCSKLKFVFLFKKNSQRYKITSDKGVRVNCRKCTVKRFINQNGEVIKHNSATNRYDTVTKKVNLITIIKEYFI